MTDIIISSIDDNDKILGMGSVTENQISWIPAMDLATSDMVWAGVIFRWGFIGFILFILLYVFSLTNAFFFYLKSEGVLSDLALMFILFIISQIIEGFVSWTFMSAHGFATGLWYFAMLSALLGSNKVEGLSNKKILSNE
jgi:membrane-associated HD superfamily phosphohydrolase